MGEPQTEQKYRSFFGLDSNDDRNSLPERTEKSSARTKMLVTKEEPLAFLQTLQWQKYMRSGAPRIL